VRGEEEEEDPKKWRADHLMDSDRGYGYGTISRYDRYLGALLWGAGEGFPEEKFPFSAQKFKIEIGTCRHFQIQNLCDFMISS